MKRDGEGGRRRAGGSGADRGRGVPGFYTSRPRPQFLFNRLPPAARPLPGVRGAYRGIGQAMFQWSVQKIHLPQSLSEEANADELSD